MERVEASKLARGMGGFIERLLRGESFEVTRYGRVVAVLTPRAAEEPASKPETKATPRGRQTVDQILADSRRAGR